jgi:hypothetical protein
MRSRRGRRHKTRVFLIIEAAFIIILALEMMRKGKG